MKMTWTVRRAECRGHSTPASHELPFSRRSLKASCMEGLGQNGSFPRSVGWSATEVPSQYVSKESLQSDTGRQIEARTGTG